MHDQRPPLRLTWTRTWPDDPRAKGDFIARVDGSQVARIYLSSASGAARWQWVCAGEKQIGAGWMDTGREADQAAEDAYFAAMGCGRD